MEIDEKEVEELINMSKKFSKQTARKEPPDFLVLPPNNLTKLSGHLRLNKKTNKYEPYNPNERELK